ncbi:MAG: hypothetical protein ABIY70_13575 [Capsulimonas sp.]|uniref:hypothetical protein n=1 Tax=Capsulimonas sp. TaxID=2494211 RepID=UPI003266DBD8
MNIKKNAGAFAFVLLLIALGAGIHAKRQTTPGGPLPQKEEAKAAATGWLRDSYTGPGGGLYTGPGGGLYEGPGGGAYSGPSGGMYSGPDGGMYTGPGGGLYSGPGGGLYTGPGGGLYTGPGGGLYTGPGGGLYDGPGGGLYTGPCDEPYRSNWPPREAVLKYLKENNQNETYALLKEKWSM